MPSQRSLANRKSKRSNQVRWRLGGLWLLGIFEGQADGVKRRSNTPLPLILDAHATPE